MNALREIHAESGMSGIERLSASCPNQSTVGFAVAKMEFDTGELADWITATEGNLTSQSSLRMTIRGLLRSLAEPYSSTLIGAVLERGQQQGWDAGRSARFLALAREERATWEIVTSCGDEVDKAYWATTSSGFWSHGNRDDVEFALHHLLEAGRPRSALQVCHYEPEKVDANLLVEILERSITHEEPDEPFPGHWYIRRAVEWLEASGVVDKARLIRLEFNLFPALSDGHEDEYAAALYAAIMSDPGIFTELLCVRYQPANEEHREAMSENMHAVIRTAWDVLFHCRRQPGTQPDGTIDRNAFLDFVQEARQLCEVAGRLDICDQTLGQILAHAPTDADGTWPFEPARSILDQPELEEMRRGFHIGVHDKRGGTVRAPDEGGDQERDLASTYHNYARHGHNTSGRL